MLEQRGKFKVMASKTVYKNPWMSVREDNFEHENGKKGIFGVVTMKVGSTVLPLTDDGCIFLVKEFKYAVNRDIYELMSGGLDNNESPLDCAQRELREELGLQASEWIDLGWVDPFTSALYAPNHIFIALNLTNCETEFDELEEIEPIKMPFSEAVEMVMDGKITHAASCVCILKAWKYLQNHPDWKDKI